MIDTQRKMKEEDERRLALNLLHKEEHLQVLWQHVQNYQIGVEFTIGMIVILCLLLLIGFGSYSLGNRGKFGNWFSSAGICFFGLVILLGMFCITTISRNDVTTIAPVQVVDQNIRIIKQQRRLPKLIKKKDTYNHRYEVMMKKSKKASTNLELQSKGERYRHKYLDTKQKITDIRSLMSYGDSEHQAKTKFGGFYPVRKPERIDYYVPNHYYFKK